MTGKTSVTSQMIDFIRNNLLSDALGLGSSLERVSNAVFTAPSRLKISLYLA